MKSFSKPDNQLVVFSSLSYILVGIFYIWSDFILVIFLSLTTIISILHHSYPKKQIIRITDWSTALILVLYVFTKNNTLLSMETSVNLFILIIFLTWLTSFVAFRKRNIFYTILPTYFGTLHRQ